MDMTSIWIAEPGWCYLNAIVDCCTREIPAWDLDLRCRRQEAEAVVSSAVAAHGVEPGRLTLGTDNGTAYTSRGFRSHLTGLGIAHRCGGSHDPESQAFLESWFSKLKERLVWRSEFETLEEARAALAAYVETCHHRPSHSRLLSQLPGLMVPARLTAALPALPAVPTATLPTPTPALAAPAAALFRAFPLLFASLAALVAAAFFAAVLRSASFFVRVAAAFLPAALRLALVGSVIVGSSSRSGQEWPTYPMES